MAGARSPFPPRGPPDKSWVAIGRVLQAYAPFVRCESLLGSPGRLERPGSARPSEVTNARDRFVAFRRSLPRTPPLERQTVRVRGLAFAVFTTPPPLSPEPLDAPPLLCINGGMLYGHSMLWPALSPLAQRRQIILYDQRGRGGSEAPADPGAASIEDDAADIPALRRALGVRRWDVLGHSWGGGIAMLATSLDHAGTRRLVTVDAVGPTNAWMPVLRDNVRARLPVAERESLDRITDRDLEHANPQLQAAYARIVYPAWFADAELARFFAPPKVTSDTGAAVLARLRRDGYDWRSRLRALSLPTLVIHGEEDALPASVAAELTALMPRAQGQLIPHSGHMPFWEAPDVFFPIVDSFLAAPVHSPGGVRQSV
jgi:proline iminopeptidase